LAAWRGSDDAAQAAPYLADAFGEDWVVESSAAMLVGDRAAGQVDAADRLHTQSYMVRVDSAMRIASSTRRPAGS
jgi:hypothetical protein